MTGFNRIVLVVIAVLGCTAVAWAQDEPTISTADVVEMVKRGVVRVMNVSIDDPVAAAYAGGGSGVVFEVDYATRSAYAITNHHVSGNASTSQVKFWNNATYRAELVATEPGIDIALLRIHNIPDESGVPEEQRTIVPVPLGNSDLVQIGEWGIAMGNPGAAEGINTNRSDPWDDFLLQQTVTTNVITGRDTPLEFMVGIWRQNQGDLGFQYGTNLDYTFRISVPINPGNSGGPLFNSQGEVIGINFYGGAQVVMQNHNWAIPINLAKDFVFQILETGRFEKPWLGLDIIMPSYIRSPASYQEFAEKYRGDEITVYGVRADSPAARAGIKQDDIILEVDGRVFATPEEVRLYVFDLDIGDTVELLVMRQGHKERIFCEVGPKRKYDAEFSV